MTARDIVTDLVDITYPLRDHPGGSDDQSATWWALYEEAAERREMFEERLRESWAAEGDFDPLLAEIAAARNVMLASAARMRMLIAYGREFSQPRPYRLEDLAQAAGMSVSDVGTVYDGDEVAEVARRTGARPTHRLTEPALPPDQDLAIRAAPHGLPDGAH